MCALNVAIASQLIYLSDNRVSRVHRSYRYIELFPLCWNCCLHTPSRYLFNYFGVRSVMIAQLTINMQVSKGVSAHTSRNTSVSRNVLRRQLHFQRTHAGNCANLRDCKSHAQFYIWFCMYLFRDSHSIDAYISNLQVFRPSCAAHKITTPLWVPSRIIDRLRHPLIGTGVWSSFVKIACDRQSHY